MKKYYLLLLVGLFLIFWAISFYLYNPTFIDPTFQYKIYPGLLPVELKTQISLIFFWGLLAAGLGLVIFSCYKLFLKKNKK